MKKLVLLAFALPLFVVAQTTLPTLWNFSTPGISTPPTGWITGLGTNGNLTYSGAGFSVGGDNTACRLDATGEFLTIWFAGNPGEVSYWLKGSGISPAPAFTGIFSVQESVDGTAWTDLRAFTTANPLTSTMSRFVNTPAATSRYIRFFYTTKEAGSNVALDSVVLKAAPLPPVLLSVKQNNTTLVSGNTFVSGNTANTLFTIQNNGTAIDLKTDSIVLSGTHSSDFSIGAFDSITSFGGQKDSFNLSFTAGAPGSRFATLKIYTTDAANSPFTINLYAIGGTLATEPAAQVATLGISNVRTHAFTVSKTAATVSEKYIILRKPATTLTEVPVDGVSYKRGDYVGGAQVAYIGDDTASFRPNYILANANYTFAAFAFNGPAGYENYKTTTPATATTTTPGGQPGNYYAGVNPLVNTFIADLNAKIRMVDTVFYSSYASVVVNNYLARDTTGGKKVVTCVYSGEEYVYEDPFLWWTGTGGNPATLTREHTFAQSWMPTNTGGSWPTVGGKEVSEYNDLHHLFPTHQLNANAKRSNNPFGMVVNATYTAPTGFGKLGTDAGGKTVYEPKDDQKGDLARALFYMLVRYNGINGVQWRLPTSQDIAILLTWHQQDPPSAIEIARNEYISTTQKNRNPFIDNPSWVNRINFSNMTYVLDPTAEVINVTAPNGGEATLAGNNLRITWTSQNVDTAVVEYKTAPAGAWTLISDTTPGARGFLNWTVPSVTTTSAKVRITKKSNLSVTDSSNGGFTINVPTLTITAPNGNEIWFVNNPNNQYVTWNSSFVDSILVELLIEDTVFKSYGKVAAEKDSLGIVATGLPLSNKAKFRLTSVSPAISSSSANYFRLQVLGGLSSMLPSNTLSIYPNPSTGIVTIQVNDPSVKSASVTVSDITGRVVLEKQLLSSTQLELTKQGVYFLKLQTEKGSVVQKLIIQ
ncbi:MAG: endonuclease [Bacteroidota bacterium]